MQNREKTDTDTEEEDDDDDDDDDDDEEMPEETAYSQTTPPSGAQPEKCGQDVTRSKKPCRASNNTLKEEKLIFGAKQWAGIRMLGCWVDLRIDTQNRIARAAKLWAKLKPQLIKCRLSKRQQALVLQACVESGLLFNAATRSWQKMEIKTMQSWIDRTYRYIWSNKKEAPSRRWKEATRTCKIFETAFV